MGCSQSSPEPAAASNNAEDPRRARQAEKRKKSQEAQRPSDPDKQEELQQNFEKEASGWPARTPWYKTGKHTQGINIMIADPEPLREQYYTLVVRNAKEYSVGIGYGKQTKFDAHSNMFHIQCSTVSQTHATLHFKRENGVSTVTIEDKNSLNGTFVLGRPAVNSSRRPMLEKEVRSDIHSLDGVEYIRLGSACVLVLEPTNIYWEDEEDDDDADEPEAEEKDLVPEMLESGWYFPKPCPPKLAEIAAKERDVADKPASNKQPAVVV